MLKKPNLELMEMEWEEKSKELFRDMDEWRENYNHRTPCDEYKKTNFCPHLIKARTQKFRNSIKELIGILLQANGLEYT